MSMYFYFYIESYINIILIEYLIPAVQKAHTYFNSDVSSSSSFNLTLMILRICCLLFMSDLSVTLKWKELKDETFLLIFLSMPCVHMFDFFRTQRRRLNII